MGFINPLGTIPHVNGNDTVRESTLWSLDTGVEILEPRGWEVKVSVKDWSGGGGGRVAGVRAGAAGVDLPTVSFLTSGDILVDSDGLKCWSCRGSAL
jgi:hypothetical protein